MPERVLVWGATGFIGRELVKHLRRRDIPVVVLTRVRSEPSGWPFDSSTEVVETGYLRNASARSAMQRALRDVSIVYNLAGSSGAVASNSDPQQSLEDNCAWQLDFLDACARAGNTPHVVFASSRLVYGKPGTPTVDESHPLDPGSMYAAHKLCIENYHRINARQNSITACICRISNPFGRDANSSRKNHGFLNSLIERGCARKPLIVFGDGGQLRDYIYIKDLVRALVLCGEHPAAANEIFNLGSGQGVSLVAAASEIGRLSGSPVVFHPWPDEYSQVETGDYVNNINKVRRVLDFCPHYTFQAGLQEAIFGTQPSDEHAKTCVTLETDRVPDNTNERRKSVRS